MEIVCQLSYPLNSENASPFGTRTVYLAWPVSCAEVALLPRTVSTETASETTTITTPGSCCPSSPLSSLSTGCQLPQGFERRAQLREELRLLPPAKCPPLATSLCPGARDVVSVPTGAGWLAGGSGHRASKWTGRLLR